MKRQTTTKAVASAVATIDYFVKRGWDVSYGIGDIRMFNEDAPEYIYILTIYRWNTELYLENYESLEDLPKERRKAPCFSYGDIRRALSCVMW